MKINYQTHEHEHEFEAVPGLPEPLPAGERLLWQGSPDWRRLAIEALHVRKVAVYFALLVAWRVSALTADGLGALQVITGTLALVALGTLAVGLLATIAWLVARTSVYTLTDRRVAMRIGIVLTVTFNLPLSCIEAAALHRLPHGQGDIALTLVAGEQIGYLHLWPHARPWRLKRTEPTLRAVADAEQVARRLTEAVAAHAGRGVVETTTRDDHAPRRQPVLAA